MDDWEKYNSYHSRPSSDPGSEFGIFFLVGINIIVGGVALAIYIVHHL